MSEEFRFDDLAPVAIPVTFRGKHYVLTEASAGDVLAWRIRQYQHARFDAEGNATERSVQDVFESQTFLVSCCLYLADRPGAPPLDAEDNLDRSKRVPLEMVRAWPDRIIDKLLEKVMAISELNVKETKEALEKRLVETVQKLSAWLEAPEERVLWRDWIMAEVDRVLEGAEQAVRQGRRGTPETQEPAEKNGQTVTSVTST